MARNLDIGALSAVGDVEVLERLGVGVGSGRFKARLGGGGPAVSLLLVEAEKFDKAGLMDWARRLKRVDHPGVPGVLQIEDVLEPGFVAQRFVEGDTLDGRVERRGGPLPPVEALALVLQTAAALRAAHRNEIAHGALAPRSLVLEARDGAMDAVRLVGWRPLQAGLSFEKAVGRDLRALGEFLYLALAAVPAPGVSLPEPIEPGAAVAVDFGDLADAWGRSGRGGGPGRSVFGALAAARRMTTVDAFVDALLPEFSRLAGDALAEVAYELSADREFKAEVQRQRDRQRELESKLRFIRDWLRDNAPAIEVVDDRVAGLEAQERSLRNLEVELAMLLDRPVRAGAGTAAPMRARPPEPRAPVVEPEAEPEEAEEPPASPTLDAPRPPAAGGGLGRLIAVAGVAAALAGGIVWFATRPPADAPAGALTQGPVSAPLSAPDSAPTSAPPTAGAPISKAPDSTAVSAAPATAPASAPPTAAPAPATVAPETVARPLPPAPPGMVAIPAGKVATGLSAEQRTRVLDQCRVDTAEVPKAAAALCVEATLAGETTQGSEQVGAFYIDRLEVSQLMYDRCVNQRGCKTLKLTWELDEQPATGVTWEMARQYCEHQGGRLPTLNEWLRAARGDEQRIYAWGDEPPAEDKRHRANYGRYDDRRGPGPGRADGHKYAAPVGVYAERGASPFGVANLSDNVREWTSTEGPDGGALVAGGGWRDLGMDLRVTRTASVPKDQYFNDLGFRCVVDLVLDR